MSKKSLRIVSAAVLSTVLISSFGSNNSVAAIAENKLKVNNCSIHCPVLILAKVYEQEGYVVGRASYSDLYGLDSTDPMYAFIGRATGRKYLPSVELKRSTPLTIGYSIQTGARVLIRDMVPDTYDVYAPPVWNRIGNGISNQYIGSWTKTTPVPTTRQTTPVPTTRQIPANAIPQVVSDSFSTSSIALRGTQPSDNQVLWTIRVSDPQGRLSPTVGGQLCPPNSSYPSGLFCTGALFGRNGTAFQATYQGLFWISPDAPGGDWIPRFDPIPGGSPITGNQRLRVTAK